MPRSRTADAGRDAPASERQGAASRRVRNVRAPRGGSCYGMAAKPCALRESAKLWGAELTRETAFLATRPSFPQ
jgi:hypothetical protein